MLLSSLFFNRKLSEGELYSPRKNGGNMAITAKELAKKLGLSESAISLALNNKPGVSTYTRKKVVSAAKEFGYDFSRIHAQESPGASRGTIYFIFYRKHGAIVTDTPFFSQLSAGVEAECQIRQYDLNILYLYDEKNIDKLLLNWTRIGVKGIVLLGTEMSEQDFIPFTNSPIPLVLLDNYFENQEVDSVLINNVRGAFTATNYLIQKRKQQPGYLRSAYPINNFENRADGFYKSIRENGMSPSRSIVHRLTPSVEGACADMNALLEDDEPLASCYFADNDQIATGAIKAFREKGYRVPLDISVIGFDDVPLCTYIEPPLSTIRVPKQYMGKLAVRRLCELIQDPDNIPVKMEVATSLIDRKSISPRT